MPAPFSTNEGTDPPGTLHAKLSALLDGPAARAAARSLFGAELGAISFGLPRASASPTRGGPRGPEVIVTCAGVLESDEHALAFALPAASAEVLVDRMLGGARTIGVAARASQLSDAECGVLAYAAARLLTAADVGLCVRDVRPADERSTEPRAAELEWPCALTGPLGTLEARVLLGEASALASAICFELELYVEDDALPDALRDLLPGDVLVSDGVSLTGTSRGLAGSALVSARDIIGRLLVALEHGRAETLRVTAPPEPLPLRFVLARRRVSLSTLARIAGGSEPAFVNVTPGEVVVSRSGVAVAAGELVTVRGALGVRLTRCDSAATPAHPPA